MTFSRNLVEYVSACFTGLWIRSFEPEEALREIAGVCHEEGWRLAVWDIDRGLQISGAEPPVETGAADPLGAVRAAEALAAPESSSLLVLSNLHRFLDNAEMVQALARQVHLGKQTRTFLVVLSPVVQLPVELEKLFVVLDHDLPERAQLEEIARGIATEEGELPDGVELSRVLDAAGGLSRYEAEGAFSLSLVRHGAIRPEAIWELKAGMLKKSGLVSLHRGGETFAGLGGLEALKSFCLRAMGPAGHKSRLTRPRGVMLLGVPGTGKSAFAKALGAETGRPTLILDVGALLGSLVGQTEQNIRRALQIADRMAPCILFCDEIEKALSGVASSGQTDSGVSARLFGTLLSWLSDHESDVFFIGTCNDISKLPPEFSRSERFDAVWFLDLPGAEQKRAIWEIYYRLFGLDFKQPKPNDRDWTGAEIRSCCRLAALLDVRLVEAAEYVVPVARMAGDAVERLRQWAAGRCLDADRGGIYRQPGSNNAHQTRRKLVRSPEAPMRNS